MMPEKTGDILDRISALQRLELGDLDRLVRIRNRILDNDVRQDDIDYVYGVFGQVRDMKRSAAPPPPPSSGRRSSRAWYLLPIFLSVVGGAIAYLGLRRKDPVRARNTLLLGSATFAMFVAIVAAGNMPDPNTVDHFPPSVPDRPVPAGNDHTDIGLDSPLGSTMTDAIQEGKPSIAPEAATVLRERETHTVSYADIPSYADPNLAVPALEQALHVWESSNAFLGFETVESGADLHIEWRRWMPAGGLGLHTVFDVESDSAGNHVIAVRLGNDDCHSDYLPYSTASLRHTLAHEIGHYLGLRHVDDKGHLMYSGELFDVDAASVYDDRGYDVPSVDKPTVRTQHGQEILAQVESVEQDLHKIVAEREELRSGTGQGLQSNTMRYNEAVLLLDSLENDLECAELASAMTRLK